MSAVLDAPDGMEVIVQKAGRNLDQNAKFHAMCEDFAKHGEHMGRTFDRDQWKHLLVSAHAIETKQPFEPVCGLAGEFLNIRESTAKMSKERMCSLIEFACAIAAEKGITLRRLD